MPLTRPIRVAFITPGLLLGGAERWLVSLIKYSDPSRIRWTGVAVSPWGGADGSLCKELSQWTELHCMDPQNESNSNGRKFEMCGFHGIHPDWSTAVDKVCRNAELILSWGSVETSAWFSNYSAPRVLVSHTTRREVPLKPITGVTHLASVSEAAADYFQGRMRAGYDNCRVAVIFNGAELPRCLPVRGRQWQRECWGIAPSDIAVGYIGRQAPEKNYLAAARAISVLPRKFKAVYHGSIVKEPGIPAEDLLRIAESFPDRIIVRPPESRVGDILAGLDVFMLASHREAFSLGMIEAWLAGVPVVATPVGSIPELQRRYGPLVLEVPLDPNPAQLAHAVQQANSPEGQKIAERAKLLAQAHFTCEVMANRWMNYLEGIAHLAQRSSLRSRFRRMPLVRRFEVRRRKAFRRKAHV